MNFLAGFQKSTFVTIGFPIGRCEKTDVTGMVPGTGAVLPAGRFGQLASCRRTV